jgi:hypothetical protein
MSRFRHVTPMSRSELHLRPNFDPSPSTSSLLAVREAEHHPHHRRGARVNLIDAMVRALKAQGHSHDDAARISVLAASKWSGGEGDVEPITRARARAALNIDPETIREVYEDDVRVAEREAVHQPTTTRPSNVVPSIAGAISQRSQPRPMPPFVDAREAIREGRQRRVVPSFSGRNQK